MLPLLICLSEIGVAAAADAQCEGSALSGPIAKSYKLASASITRTACYGTCPSYSISVQKDGRLQYRGESYVDVEGARVDSVSPAQLAALEKAFADFQFFRRTNQYGCHELTDAPSVTVRYESEDGRSMSIRHYHGCKSPCGAEELTAFENKLDEILDSERFTGVKKRR